MVSSATPTVIRMDVPPNGTWVTPQNARAADGINAIAAKKIAPGNVIRTSTSFKYFAVGAPGRIPGMNPPYLRMLSAVSTGLNAIAV